MAKEEAKKAPKARVVDSFMTTYGNALDVNRFSIEGQWVKREMNRLAIGLLG